MRERKDQSKSYRSFFTYDILFFPFLPFLPSLFTHSLSIFIPTLLSVLFSTALYFIAHIAGKASLVFNSRRIAFAAQTIKPRGSKENR